MPAPTTPAELMTLAKCWLASATPEQRSAIQTYLLAVIAGGSTDPATLLAQAKCFVGLPDKTQQAIQTYLLCQIVNV